MCEIPLLYIIIGPVVLCAVVGAVIGEIVATRAKDSAPAALAPQSTSTKIGPSSADTTTLGARSTEDTTARFTPSSTSSAANPTARP